MSILNLSPLKYEIYGGILIAALIAGSIAVHRHDMREQAIGEQKVLVADNKLAAEVKAHNTDLQNAAADKDAATEKAYEDALLDTNLLPAPSLVCKRPASAGGSTVPGPKPGSSGSGAIPQQGVSAPDNGSGDSFDPSRPLVKIGHDKDAQIKALQDDVAELLGEMQNGKVDNSNKRKP